MEDADFVLQLRGDQVVAVMNLLDAGLDPGDGLADAPANIVELVALRDGL